MPQNKNAESEAEAALCVGKLGGNTAFWSFSEKIYQHVSPTEGGTGLSLSLLPQFAKEVGISQKDFEKCLSSGEMKGEVQQQVKDAMAAGVFNLPGTFVIDGKGNTILISGNQPYSLVKTIVNEALAGS